MIAVVKQRIRDLLAAYPDMGTDVTPGIAIATLPAYAVYARRGVTSLESSTRDYGARIYCDPYPQRQYRR